MASAALCSEERERLITSAREVTANAYAPYSGFHVGAAVLTESGSVFSGCNVENASYGLTVCAERAAIFRAVAVEGSGMRIRAIAVQTSHGAPAPPCGACRQVLLEFNPDTLVLFQDNDGMVEAPVRDLMPHAFRLE